MGGLGAYFVDDLLDFYANTHRFDTGAATDADGSVAYRVYESSTTTPLLTGTMTLLDSANTAGFYQAQMTLSAANGFEAGKSYAIYISAAVNSITGTMHHHFRVGPVQANVTQLVGVAQSAADLKDFADDGYDPSTNKVQGVVLADATTTVNGLAANVITATSIATGAFTAAKFAAGAFDAVWTVTTRELTAFSTALALSVWHVLESAIVTASTIGLKLKTNLDATISSRSTYAGADTSGTTTLLSRIVGTLATGTHQPQSGDSFARLGAPTGASLSADLVTLNTDTNDIQARLPTALVAGHLSANVKAINDSTVAAVGLGRSAATIVSGTVDTTAFTPTTTEFEADDITVAGTDHFKGRTLIFTSGTLQNQATSISAYSVVAGRGHFTCAALNASPADNITFCIV